MIRARLALSTVVFLGLGACYVASDGGDRADGAHLEQVGPCAECQTILIECTSTSTDEQQFLGCRDLFQECQRTRELGATQCSNPTDAEACSQCRDRLAGCVERGAAAETCELQFSVCKAFLLRSDRAAEACTTEPVPPVAARCELCQADAVACASDAGGSSSLGVCTTAFGHCKEVHELDEATCDLPGGDAACTACATHHAGCAAAGGNGCDEAYQACTEVLAPLSSCPPPGVGEGGEGGQGGTGEGAGAGGAGGDLCGQDLCQPGPAVHATCSPCAQAVCDQDDFCCGTEWDVVCADHAAATPSCGC